MLIFIVMSIFLFKNKSNFLEQLRLIWKIIILSLLIFFSSCNEKESTSFLLEGKWKEQKSNSIYDQFRREFILDIQKEKEEFYGKMVGLDYPLEDNKELRKCSHCGLGGTKSSLLGYPILKDLKKKGNSYFGKYYEVNQRKWFDVRVNFLDENTIQLRLYAYLTIFGKTFKLEKADTFYKESIKFTDADLNENNEDLYAISLGMKESFQTQLDLFNQINLNSNQKMYFFDSSGKLIDTNRGEYPLNGINYQVVLFLNKKKLIK
jgi:uncharacterized protein (DUF2147 family)